MQPFPHVYRASANATDRGPVTVAAAGLPALRTALSPEFGGEEARWSPETLLAGAVADCLVLNFRGIARAIGAQWTSIQTDVEATLARVDLQTRVTDVVITARVGVPAMRWAQPATDGLRRAAATCVVANSLRARIRLDVDVRVDGPAHIPGAQPTCGPPPTTGSWPTTLHRALRYFADPDVCFRAAMDCRWGGGAVTCPTCGSRDVRFIATRRIWRCARVHARRQFSVRVGTVMEGSRIPLDKWMVAIWLLVDTHGEISSYELHRRIGVTQKSAWFMLHRIHLALRGQVTAMSRGVARTRPTPARRVEERADARTATRT